MKPSMFCMSFLFTVLISFTTGCLGWEPGWKAAQAPAPRGDAAALFKKGRKLIDEADTKEKVQQSINAFESAVNIDPENSAALEYLSNSYFLMGYGYSNNPEDKKAWYIKSLQTAERAMYTNPEFRALVDRGEPVWDSCRVLKKENMLAMYTWYHGVAFIWEECCGGFGKMVNMQWLDRAKKVLERMTVVGPGWGSGSINILWAIHYAVIPGLLGGDMKKAEDYFNKAIALGPRMNNFYIARAILCHANKKDRKAFVEDLNRAIAIDPRRADSQPYAWAVLFQRQSRQILRDTETYFK